MNWDCSDCGYGNYGNDEYCASCGDRTNPRPTMPIVKDIERDNLELYIAEIPNDIYALLYGPPGTGKTSLLVSSAKKRNKQYKMITLTAEQDRSALIGHMIPTSKGFRWMDGPLTSAMRHGLPLIINEIDKASQDVSDCLHPALDDQKAGLAQLIVVKENPDDPDDLQVETLYPAEGFRVDATMNGSPSELAPAVLDRFGMIARVPAPSVEQLEQLPEHLRSFCTQMYENAKINDVLPQISYRQLRNFSRFCDMSIPVPEAALLALNDQDIAQSLIETLTINGNYTVGA